MKILVITGSPRKHGNCRMIIQTVTNCLQQQQPGVEIEILHLADLDLPLCRGCAVCIHKDEKLCAHRAAVAEICNRIALADALLFTSPVYAHQVSGLMKNLIDHLSFLFHRPLFVGKPALVIATTDGSGLKETLKYLSFTATVWGFYLTGRIGVVMPFYTWSHAYQVKIQRQLTLAVQKLIAIVRKGHRPSPTLHELLTFRGMRQKAAFIPCDKAFWQEQGWFDRDYYLDIPVHPLRGLLANAYEGVLNMFAGSFTKKFLTAPELETIRTRVRQGKGNTYDQQLLTYLDAALLQNKKTN